MNFLWTSVEANFVAPSWPPATMKKVEPPLEYREHLISDKRDTWGEWRSERVFWDELRTLTHGSFCPWLTFQVQWHCHWHHIWKKQINIFVKCKRKKACVSNFNGCHLKTESKGRGLPAPPATMKSPPYFINCIFVVGNNSFSSDSLFELLHVYPDYLIFNFSIAHLLSSWSWDEGVFYLVEQQNKQP